jgi:hypothetical protein
MGRSLQSQHQVYFKELFPRKEICIHLAAFDGEVLRNRSMGGSAENAFVFLVNHSCPSQFNEFPDPCDSDNILNSYMTRNSSNMKLIKYSNSICSTQFNETSQRRFTRRAFKENSHNTFTPSQ